MVPKQAQQDMSVNANAIQGMQPGPARNQLARSPEIVNRDKKGQ